jgi:Uma2 family endonuclease
MSTVNSSAEQRILLGNVSWSTYVALAESADNPRGRMAFDQGVLEIMSPSSTHEFIKNLIGRFVETFTLEMDIDIRSVSSTTFRRPDLEKAVEADECYYIQSVEKIRGVDEIDLSIHPAPDLAIEVDITRSSTIKQGIYAALHVPELWEFDGEILQVLTWESGGYVESAESLVLPGFPLHEAQRLLRQRHAMGETRLVRSFQQFLRNMRQ